MRLVVQDSPGGPEVLHLVEAPVPAPGLTEVQVRVHAAGINPVDWKVRSRSASGTVGWDVSGVVTAVAPGVTRFAVGDEVFGMPRFPAPANAYGEYVTAPARHFARKPAGTDHIHAAALPLASLTAWQSLVDTARIRAGQRVLIHAAAGGVGHLAVQIAKAHGAYVLGTASAAKHDFLHGIGVDEPIDYHAVDFAETVRDVDVVLDTLGGDYLERSLRTLRPNGIVITIVDYRRVAEVGDPRAIGLLVEPDHSGLEQIAELVEKGQLRAHIAATFPLHEAVEAHRLGEAGRTTGKIVLTVA